MIFDVDQGPKTMDLIKYLLHSRGASIVMAYPAKGNSQRQISFQESLYSSRPYFASRKVLQKTESLTLMPDGPKNETTKVES